MGNPLDKLLNARKAASDAAASRNRPKANYFSWPASNSVVVRFCEELSDASPEYNAERGLFHLEVVHELKDDFKRKSACTMESEGSCLVEELMESNRELYYNTFKVAKSMAYFNVVADLGEGLKVYQISRPAASAFVSTLISENEDEENITGANYRLRREGEGTSTTWILKRLDPSKSEPLSYDGLEIPNLKDSVFRVSRDRQETYFGVSLPKEESGDSVSVAKKVAEEEDDEWV